MTVAGAGRPTRQLPAGLVVLVVSAGCSLLQLDPTPDPEAGPGLAGDCMPPFVLHEETTLGALGLAQLDDMGLELNRRGTVRITEATMRWEDFAPPDVPPLVSEGQLLCVTWADGSGFSTLLQEPYGKQRLDIGAVVEGSGPPFALLGAAAVVVVVIVVSWLAFRREEKRAR